MEVSNRPASSVSHVFLQRLIVFASPRKFSAESTSFDMGYEQCKRDLLALTRAMVPAVNEMIANSEPTHAASKAPDKQTWCEWLSGKQ